MLKGDKDIHDVVEYVLMYQKTNSFIINKRIKDKPEDEFEGYEYRVAEKGSGRAVRLGSKDCTVFASDEFEVLRESSSETGLKKINIRGGLREGNSSGRFYVANMEQRISEDGYNVLYKVPDMGDDGLGYRYFLARENESKKNGNYFQGTPKTRMSSNLLPYPSFFNFQAEFNRLGYEGVVSFRNSKKPEALIQNFFNIAAVQENDWVLDSFLGSGTTCAVAHKNKLRWVGVELGEHANTHVLPRLRAVVDGEDPEGVTQQSNWSAGGGFKFYNLAPSLLKKDKHDNWVIDEKYNGNMLAAAMAKQEGFHFNPDEQVYWKQARSTEKDFLFTTTQFLTLEMLDAIHDEMQPEESLLIACKAYHDDCAGKYANISIKKIPQILLGRCEFGRDDYGLNIINAPVVDDEEEEPEEDAPKAKKGKKKKDSDQLELLS
jgi:adenine-specific DNA-methyltransferase